MKVQWQVSRHITGLINLVLVELELVLVVLLQRRADQFLQLRIVKGLPPRQVGERCALRFRRLRLGGGAERRWDLHIGAMVFRPHGAGRDQERCAHNEAYEQRFTHVTPLLLATVGGKQR